MRLIWLCVLQAERAKVEQLLLAGPCAVLTYGEGMKGRGREGEEGAGSLES